MSRIAERAASAIAMHDQKTGLPNRTLFDDRLAQAKQAHADLPAACRHGARMAGLPTSPTNAVKFATTSAGLGR